MGYDNVSERKGVGVSVQNGLMALLIGLSLIAVSFACVTMIFLRRKEPVHTPRVEKRRDDALKETFPASDAPASQYFDIPVNRL